MTNFDYKSVASQLDQANKLIFVKQYEQAAAMLSSLAKDGGGLMVELRRIELAMKLGTIDTLREEYLDMVRATGSVDVVAEVCLLLLELHGESPDITSVVSRFKQIIADAAPDAEELRAACYFGIGYAFEQSGNFKRAIYSYEQSIACHPKWLSSYFGLSQCYYHQGQDALGDRYFYLFEKDSPFNVYGNFETHRRLSKEYLQTDHFVEAEAAIVSLSEWWIENKGHCPLEIQIYESLMRSEIHETKSDQTQAAMFRSQARVLAMQLLEDEASPEGVLFFVAKALEEYAENELALDFYKRVLRIAGDNPKYIQKIGSQFLSSGQFDHALTLFNEAYEAFPDNHEIRFCRLVAKLKIAGVDVEEYLALKDRLKSSLAGGASERVELLGLLHALLAKFDEDAEVYEHMAELHIHLGNREKAISQFEKMLASDPLGRKGAIKFATFLMTQNDSERAIDLVNHLHLEELPKELQSDVLWLRSSYLMLKGDFKPAQELLDRVIAVDPWNVTYLVHEIHNVMQFTFVKKDMIERDSVVNKLLLQDEDDLNWSEFDKITKECRQANAFRVEYSRLKLRFLYSDGDSRILQRLIVAAARFDAARCAFELIRLLNTNFDSPSIYWALGYLYKELWQLETASVWFEQVLSHPDVQNEDKGIAYLEMADCLVWQERDLKRAIEYVKLAGDFGGNGKRISNVLAHAHLKNGDVRQARGLLAGDGKHLDVEGRYLSGLLHYRNGAKEKANEIWKPLLTARAESIRFHNMKQNILRYYFDREPYLKVN